MGERQGTLFEPEFNRAVKVKVTDERLTSDAGLVMLREADHRLGLTESLAAKLDDPRHPNRIRYTLTELLRQRVYALATGYESQDDLDRLAHDPAMKMAVWDRPGERVLDERLASQPTHSRLIDILAYQEGNRETLRDALADWIHRHLRVAGRDHAVRYATVDVDSFPLEVHGEQEGAAYNGHYQSTIYHPLVASFSVAGDYDSAREGFRLGNGFVHAVLRMGHVHTSKGALSFIQEVIRKTDALAQVLDFRLDAGLAIGEIMDYLTDEKKGFSGRLRGNSALDRLAEPHLKRPVGRPPKEGYQRVIELGKQQLNGWRHPQRLILVVTDRPDPVTGQLNLLPDYFFLVTNWTPKRLGAEQVLERYRKRGTFEDRLGEFVSAVGGHLSSHEGLDNEVTFLLQLLSFNLASILRIELEAKTGGGWDLRRFQDYVLKAGGRVIKGKRRLTLYIAQAVVGFWRLVLARVASWRLPGRWAPPRGGRRGPWVPPPPHSHLQEVLRW
jgi:hypothetical protein